MVGFCDEVRRSRSEDQAQQKTRDEEEYGNDQEYGQQDAKGGLQADLAEELEDPDSENRFQPSKQKFHHAPSITSIESFTLRRDLS